MGEENSSSAIAVPPAAAVKPGWKTTEFWATIGAAVAPYVVSAVPPATAVKVSGVVAAAYTIARGVVKLAAVLGLRKR